MAQITFYHLPDDTTHIQIQLQEQAIQFCNQYAQQGARLFIHCADQAQAEQIDERIWQQPPAQFIAHHLIGETGFHANQIEIGWFGKRPQSKRDILINLAAEAPNFAPSFTQVIDFIPYDETLKQYARVRYQIYRQAGHQLEVLALDTHKASSD